MEKKMERKKRYIELMENMMKDYEKKQEPRFRQSDLRL